ncbi:MAG: right-handed parallel beta-helix repeat-containing protein [Candidatus Zixiibacteriota bacterium]|nr:MAG: right-handed parallel beta-helix repeat-containing protein [candidate division Zixibacteria bacterium]
MKQVLTVVFGLMLLVPAWATIINIPDDYSTIQQGIDASTDGDTVRVAPGTYYGDINYSIRIDDKNIVLGSWFLDEGDTSYISSTIFDGNQVGSIQFIFGCESAVITGFTIQHCVGRYWGGGGIECGGSSPTISHNIITENRHPRLGGAGINLMNSSATIIYNTITENIAGSAYYEGFGAGIHVEGNPTISYNTITDNFSNNVGGGIAVMEGSPTISHNTISGNSAEFRGGGIYCSGVDSTVTISHNTISDNTISGDSYYDCYGGGICVDSGSAVTISHNTISGNTTYWFGGGICCNNSSPTISYNTITENNAPVGQAGGGGIHCRENSSPTISNNIISGNYAIFHGGGIDCSYSSPTIKNNTITGNEALGGSGIFCSYSSPVITNTIVWGGTANRIWLCADSSVTYCDIQDSLWPGVGNISIDPLFRDAANGDFHLMSIACGDTLDSPCIDAGDPNILDGLLDCSWGLGDPRSDMGAYGGGDSVQVAIEDEQQHISWRFALAQNFPNPFNASTAIHYNLPEACDVTVEIYDILGRKIETVVQGYQPAGYHRIVWDAGDHSSGLYFCRIQAGKYAETRKMALLK